MNKVRLIITVALLVVLLAGAYVLYNQLLEKYEPMTVVEYETVETTPEPAQTELAEATVEPEATIDPAKFAADFTVYDAEGNAVKLSDFAGKPVVINFWATWCGYCTDELPLFDNLYKRYGRDVQFMMVNLTDGQRETVSKASQFVENNDYDFPVYFDTENNVGISYNVSAIPVTVFVDENGVLIRTVYGRINEALLTNSIIKMAGDD